jgi:hypothetical protein
MEDWELIFVVTFATIIGWIAYTVQWIPLYYINLSFQLYSFTDIFREWSPLPLADWEKYFSSAQYSLSIVVVKAFTKDPPISLFSGYIVKVFAYLCGAYVYHSKETFDDYILFYVTTGCLVATAWLSSISFLLFIPFLKSILHAVRAETNRIGEAIAEVVVALLAGIILRLIPYDAIGDIDTFVINIFLGYTGAKVIAELSESSRNAIKGIFLNPLAFISERTDTKKLSAPEKFFAVLLAAFFVMFVVIASK